MQSHRNSATSKTLIAKLSTGYISKDICKRQTNERVWINPYWLVVRGENSIIPIYPVVFQPKHSHSPEHSSS